MALTYLSVPKNVTPGTTGAWTDVDDADVPDGAVGVVLHVENTSTTSDEDFGARKNGSTDNRTSAIFADQHLWLMTGVDGSGIFEVYIESANVVVYLVGYFASGSAVTFETNGTDVSLGSTGAWTDIDISTLTGVATAVGVIVEVVSTSATVNFGLRKNGSTDNRLFRLALHSWAVIGVDGSEVFEGQIASVNIDFFVTGYFTGEITLNTDAADRSLGSTGAWTDLTALPAGAIGGVYEVVATNTPTNFGLRKNGSSESILREARRHVWAFVECDGSQLVEGQIESTVMDFFEVGYFTAAINNYTIAADQGSFTLTGQTVELLEAKLVSADQGAFVLAGQDAGLLQGKLLSADNGTFALTGQDVDFTTGKGFSADEGIFTLSGQDIDFSKTYVLEAEAGLFDVSGQDVTLEYSGQPSAESTYLLRRRRVINGNV